MKYKHIIFDFDGTINDSRDFALKTFLSLTKNKFKDKFIELKDSNSKEVIEQIKDTTLKDIRKRFKLSIFSFFRLVTQVQEEEYKFILSATTEEINEQLPYYDGVLTLLESLKRGGHKLYLLSSNKQKVLDELVKRMDEQELFEDVVGGIKILGKHSKINSLIRKYRINRSEVVYVGDEIRDIEASRKAGIDIISVTWGYNSERILRSKNDDMTVTTVEELREILTR